MKRKPLLKKFVLDRSKWNPGQMFGPSALKNAHGQCCLGLYGDACGVKYEFNQSSPEENQSWPKEFNVYYNYDEKDIIDQIISTNDSPLITQKWRERKLKALFGKLGVILSYIGKLRP